jgi:hypothetical protein
MECRRHWLPGFSSYVYLLRRGDGLYKIGKSVDPEFRRKQIAGHRRFPADAALTLVAYVEFLDWGNNSTWFIEQRLHERFADRRRRVDDSSSRTEWFALSQEEADAFGAAVAEANASFLAPLPLAGVGLPAETEAAPKGRKKGGK